MKHSLMMMAALTGVTVFADTIHLKSGTVLTGGTVSAVTATDVTFKSDDLGEIKIKVENIAKIEDMGDHVVQFNDNSCETKKLAVAEGAFLADGDTLKMGDVKAIDPGVETWHGSVSAAFTAMRGNSYENSASLIGNLNRRWEIDRVKFDGGYYYSKTGQAGGKKEKTTDRWEIEGQEDHFWSAAFYNYVNLKFERDVIAELNARYRAGLGGGYQWLDGYVHEATGTWSFNQEAGLNYIKEDYESGDEKAGGFAALRYAHHLTYVPKWNDGVQCFHNMEILPEVDEWEKFLAKTDLGFSTKIIGDFDLSGKIEWDYNSMPASNRRKSDLRYIVGLGYSW